MHCFNPLNSVFAVFYVSAQYLTTTEEHTFLKIAQIVSIKLEQMVQGTSVLQLHDGHLFVI